MVNRYAVVTGGVVTNIVVSDDAFAASQEWVLLTNGFGKGDLWDGVNFSQGPADPLVQRLADLSADTLTQTAVDLLKNKTAQQIKDYMTNNVTTLPQARTVLTALTLALAYALRNQI